MENDMTVYNGVCTSLSVLQEIDKRWGKIIQLDQENMTLEASLKDKHKRKGNTYGGLAAAGAVILWNLFARHLPFPVALVLMASPVVAYFWVRSFVRKKFPLDLSQVEHNTEAINRLYDLLMTYSEDNQALLEYLPRDYRTLAAAAFFEHALANGQAETMKEAIAQYEEHQHRQNMENLSRQKVELEQRNAAVLSRIEANSAEAAREAKSAAFWSVMNYLK